MSIKGFQIANGSVQKYDYNSLDNKPILPESFVEVDDTLTEEGQAADAKATGDAVTELLSALNVLEPAATSSDVGKVLRAKTVSGGKVTSYEFGSVDPSMIQSDIEDWLKDHPEATTTVVDGAVSWAKLSNNVQQQIDELYITHEVSGVVASFTDGIAANAISVVCNISSSQSGSGDPSPTNERPITGFTGITIKHSGANVSNFDTVDVSWQTEAGTVYGGYVNVVSGELVVTWKGYNASDLTWYTTSQVSKGVFLTYVDARDVTKSTNIICNKYKTVGHDTGIGSMADLSIKGNQSSTFATYIYIRDARYTTLSDFTQNIDALFIVELAEPIHYSIAQTPVQIRKGTNNIWTNLNEVCYVRYKTTEKTYVIPEQYGAIGDGTTDDRLALETAFNSGYPVYLPEKIYYATGTIEVTEKLYLFGTGKIKFESKVAETEGIYIKNDAFIDGIEIYSTRDKATSSFEDTVLSSNIVGIRYDESLCLNLTIRNAYLHDLGCGLRGADGDDTKVDLRNIRVLQCLMGIICSSKTFHMSGSVVESIATNHLYHTLYIASPSIVDHFITGSKFLGRSFHYYNTDYEMVGTAYVFGCAMDTAIDYYGNCRFYSCDIGEVGYGGVFNGCSVKNISTGRAITVHFTDCIVRNDQIASSIEGSELVFDNCTFISDETTEYPFYLVHGSLKIFNSHIKYKHPSHCFRISDSNTDVVFYLVGCTIERPNENDTLTVYSIPTNNYIANNVVFGADTAFPTNKNNLVIGRS